MNVASVNSNLLMYIFMGVVSIIVLLLVLINKEPINKK